VADASDTAVEGDSLQDARRPHTARYRFITYHRVEFLHLADYVLSLFCNSDGSVGPFDSGVTLFPHCTTVLIIITTS
jgi:hypothetical protein